MAAPFKNYNAATSNPNHTYAGAAQAPMANPARGQTNPNWGSTFLNDLIIRPEFQGSVLEEFFQKSNFVNSGIVTRNTAMDMTAGGVVVNVPFFKAADLAEEEINSGDTWGNSGEGYLSPQKIGMSSYQIPVIHRGFAGAADDLSRLGSGEDPLGALRSYIADNMSKFRQAYLMSLLNGVFGDPTAALHPNELTGVAIATGTAASGTGTANHLSPETVIAMQDLLGERGSNLSVIAMHSAVYNQLKLQGLLTFSALLATGGPTATVQYGNAGVGVTNTEVAYFAGMRVVVSDELVRSRTEAGAAAGDAKQYLIYCFGPGAVQEGVQSGLRVETERNILSKQDIFSCDYHYLMGIPGITYSGTIGGQFPKNSDIGAHANWSLAWGHSQFVPVTRTIVNSTFGGNYA